MPATSRLPAEIRILFTMLTESGDPAVTREALEHLQSVRGHSPEAAQQLDGLFVQEIRRLRTGLEQASENQEELKAMLRRMTTPPLHPAVFLGSSSAGADGPVAVVGLGDARLVVPVADGVELGSLGVGEEVLLGNERNLLVGRSPYHALRCGQTAIFDRLVDGRAVLRWRDEEIVVEIGPELREVPLRNGDRVRWNPQAQVMVEKIEASRGEHLYLEVTPDVTWDDVGGLDAEIERLTRSIRMRWESPAKCAAYHVQPARSILLVGPPGVGKTMMVKALAHWLGTLCGGGPARFMHIKPSALHSMWYAESERNYREAFRIARERGAENPDVPVVLFFDEVDSIAAMRGDSHMRVDDRVLTAFMSELDGLEARGNVLVVTATNRLDALDPGGTRAGRLGDLRIEVPRPGMKAGRAILGKYFTPDIPYARNGHDEEAAREGLLDSAVSRLYAPNGDNDLARITLRDGRQQTVKARDLVSGASLAKIARASLERGCWRDIDTGEPGVRLGDVLAAIEEEFDDAASVLSPANCRRYLSGLPQDVDVVRVERLTQRPARTHRYLDPDAAARS